MAKWEIVRGLATDWKQHKAWWVMSYRISGGTKLDGTHLIYPQGPFFVRSFDGTDKLWVNIPEEAKLMFSQEPAGQTSFSIDPSTIWARMPAEIPAAPNVEMIYERDPWRKDA